CARLNSSPQGEGVGPTAFGWICSEASFAGQSANKFAHSKGVLSPMKLARYIGGGEIAIVDEPIPACPPGGLLVKTEASGLCSGELMDWYMEKKVPHVLGHECAGII